MSPDFPRDWQRLVARFGEFGAKRRYTVSTYLANRLDIYSQTPGSFLYRFRRCREAGFVDYRRPSEAEKRVFGSPWIAVFRRRNRQGEWGAVTCH